MGFFTVKGKLNKFQLLFTLGYRRIFTKMIMVSSSNISYLGTVRIKTV